MKITESTLLPISLVITLLGGGGFVTYIYYQTVANAKELSELKVKQDMLTEIRLDISVIKTKIEAMERRTWPRGRYDGQHN